MVATPSQSRRRERSAHKSIICQIEGSLGLIACGSEYNLWHSPKLQPWLLRAARICWPRKWDLIGSSLNVRRHLTRVVDLDFT